MSAPGTRIRGYNSEGKLFTERNFAGPDEAIEYLKVVQELCPDAKFVMVDYTVNPALLTEFRGTLENA